MPEGKCQVLIAGSRGMLGTDLTEVFEKRYGKEAVVALGREGLDVTSRPSVEGALERYQPQVLINASAYTNVDGAESEREAAYLLNAEAPRLLTLATKARGIRFIHFSTDQVFDGSGRLPRTEDEPTSPANYYAASKLEGEKAALDHPGALVLRVQWLYGKAKDRFTPLRHKEVFTPFADQYGAPTWTLKLAETVAALAQKEISGLFHYAHDDYASWAEVFAFVKQELGLSVRLAPKLTQDVILPAKRPLFSVMSNAKLKKALGVESLGSWRTELKAFLATTAQHT